MRRIRRALTNWSSPRESIEEFRFPFHSSTQVASLTRWRVLIYYGYFFRGEFLRNFYARAWTQVSTRECRSVDHKPAAEGSMSAATRPAIAAR
jgi:hypothetical protein